MSFILNFHVINFPDFSESFFEISLHVQIYIRKTRKYLDDFNRLTYRSSQWDHLRISYLLEKLLENFTGSWIN